ncbi:hypothetical protein C1645_786714 [Glomus cerebriforme]|uniref:Uncharacterized protein n=1 Tax=Glomus cerebriforme TaxID=658196 RepID=A0A397SBF9_9GLOM|nr:hypothetical protein C1645_786714 [Glomus cerebriforme]
MDSYKVLYDTFFIGFVSMISLHNFIKSFFLYHAGSDKYLTVLKIIFNVNITIYFMIEFFFYVRNDLTLDECKTISYVQMIANFFMNQSLATFGLMLIRQYEYKRFDAWASIVLLVLRVIFNVIYLFSINPHINIFPVSNDQFNICNNGTEHKENLMLLGFIDTLIDAYVMIRLIQILRKSPDSKDSINMFTLVMYWNLTTVLAAFCYHNFEHSQSNSLPIKCIVLIALSYLVTIDTENKRGYYQ